MHVQSARPRRVPLLRLALGVGVIVAALAGASTASAATFPLDVTPVTPANGLTIAPSTTGVLAFELTGSVPPSVYSVFVEISRSPTLGQDGTLADDLNTGMGSLGRRDSDPTRWYGSASIRYLNQPGTFYYQFHANASDPYSGSAPEICPDAGISACTLASPVYAFTVAAPQSQPQPQPQSQPQSQYLPLSTASAK